MLFGYVLSGDYTTASHSGPFNLLSSNYSALVDGKPGVKTLFKQTGAVAPATLQLNFSFGGAQQFEWLLPYPYLMLGVVNIGNARMEDAGTANQLTPSVKFTVNGRWNGGGAKTSQALVGPSGYSSAWAVIRKDEIVGGAATSTLQVELTGTFNSGVQAAFGNFGIGEVVIVGADYLPLRSVTQGIGGLAPTNRASGNLPWPLARSPFRTVNGVLAPESRADAFITPIHNSRNYMQMTAMAARKSGCVIAPYWRDQGTAGPNLTVLNNNAMMARLMSQPPSLAGSATENRYSGTFAFEELL